jgi:hypothetical protein
VPGAFTVTDANGCASNTQVLVQQLAQPSVFLGNDTTVVQTYALAAGTGLSSFLWSTGATSPSITVTQSGTYWVQVTNDDGCVASDTIQITVIAVGIALPQGYDISISPVPAHDRLQVRLELPADECITLSLTDLAGRALWKSQTACDNRMTLEIDLTAIASGSYLLQVAGEGLRVSKRVVVMH